MRGALSSRNLTVESVDVSEANGDWTESVEAAANGDWTESVDAAVDDAASDDAEVYVDESDDGSVVFAKDAETGIWECKPYKAQLLQAAVQRANDGGKDSHDKIVAQLNELGVRVFVIPHQSSAEMFDDINHVVWTVSKDNRCQCHAEHQSCLLYQDEQGRLFNLTIKDYAVGVASRWKDVIAGFSGFEAMVALTILTRVYPCLNDDEVEEEFETLRPGTALVLILGLVFSEETSLSWLNTAMFVRGTPSISAYALTRHVGSDWLRKIMILCLSFASSSTTGNTQRSLTISGVALACVILLANLGARAWHFLKWKPMQYSGFGAPVLAYFAAIGTGAMFPYMGHREIEAGGKAAIESIVRTAVLVAIIFLATDADQIKEHIIVGSQYCDQEWVNFAVGIWFIITLLTCLYLVSRIPPAQQWPKTDGEPLLEEDQTSPVGFTVPNLPDFPVEPLLARTGIKICTIRLELLFGVAVAGGLGALIIYSAFNSIDEDFLTDPSFPS